MSLQDAQSAVGGQLLTRAGSPFSEPTHVLLRADHSGAFPMHDDIPILLLPEIMTKGLSQPDLSDTRWAEAYEEMHFYNSEASRTSPSNALIESVRVSADGLRVPSWRGLDSPYDVAAQRDAFTHLGDVSGKNVAQLGGKGIHAVRCLLAGASSGMLVTPMLSEAEFAIELAVSTGVSERLHVVVAVAEQLPLTDGAFDLMYSGGCLHHMTTQYAASEISRVLTKQGRFAAVEPWQTRLHSIGTRLLGKREANPFCRPLTEVRLEAMRSCFPVLELVHHGPLLRYVALGVGKITHTTLSIRQGVFVSRLDDFLPLPAHLGGSVAVLATCG